MASTKKKLRLRKKNVPKDGSSKISQTMSAEASPDSKCPICLDRFNNMAYLDRCLHKFCFRCIHEWSKNKAECPLCKQPFNSIFHTIKAENDFKEFILRPTENGSFGSLDGHRFRYRTTVTRRTSPPPDNGILFEGPTGNAPPQRNRGVQRMMLRLAARRRAQTEGRSVRLMQEQEMISFRRALYRTGVRVRNVHDGGRYRDISAEFFRRNPACLHRLVPWLKRELTVLYGAHGSLVNIVQHIIMTRITRCDMEDQAIQNELKPFLLTRTEHFLHEFISFARAPYNMDAYDQHAVYDCPAPSYEEGSSSELSVITISADEADTEEDQGMVSMAGSGLSQAPWDDETPGPSYSATEQVQPATFSVSESESETSGDEEGQVMPSVQESAEVKTDPSANEGADASSTDEDCVIVGFVKPLAERTPELVQLSSDSEESVHNESTDVPAQPQHLRFPSISSPPSSVCSVVSKDKSPHGHEKSNKKESKGRDQSISRGTDTSKTCSKGMHAHDDRRHHRRDRSRSKERSRQNKKRRSKSTEKSWSIRSTTTSLNSDSTLSRGRRQSRSRSRDYPPSRDMGWQRSRDNDKSYSRHSHEKSYSYYWDSYSHYSRDRGSNDSLYMQNRSYSASYYVSPERRARSHSRSRSNRSSSSHRDYHHRERRRSRSLSSSSSRASHSAHRRSRHDKPSGKRKYKTRHLEGTSKEVTSKSYSSSSYSLPEKRGSSERYHKKSRKKSRSLSVEIVYEGKATGESSRRHKKHKKHKKKCKRHRSREKAGHRAPTVITIDSDSDHAMEASDHVRETSDQAEKENVHARDESDHAENGSDHAENGSDHARETRDYTGNVSDQAAEASDQTGNTSDQSDSSNENEISSTTGSLADTNIHESHVLAEHSASAISEDDVLTKAREATDTGDTIKSVSWQTSLVLSDESSTGTGSPSNSQETRLEEQSSVENSPQKNNCISKPFNTGPHAGICK
ncbi:E3 ubiquitin-protein ligase Topors-like [Acipenser ruthenus]|nr:E3 ubiquitin-protein ligase Topors-like [Acipenser ruthenus]XP_034774158.1 E3 ubiquitin-protein ligase Topors-like [Acipenser ruthenus]